MAREVKKKYYPRSKLAVDFNPRIPPLFLKGGLLHGVKTNRGDLVGPQIEFLLQMEEQADKRYWESLYWTSWKAMAVAVFAERRAATKGEWSQLEWLRKAAHGEWEE